MKKKKTRLWTLRRPRPDRPASTDAAASPPSTETGTRPRRASDEQMPDEAVAGRDRLSENERKPMDPGVSDADHS